jgi:hypothetical protein
VIAGLGLLALAWLVYFAVHSLLASLRVKRFFASRWPGLFPAYRMVYNLLAVLLLVPPLYFTYALPGPPMWAWQGGWAWLANGVALLALVGIWYVARYYDIGDFVGIRRWRDGEPRIEDLERFHLSPLHRFVRHPWYALALTLIWTRDMPPGFLLTAVLATTYFWWGSRLEEHKLIAYHGEVYRRYQSRVPALIPKPWRYLTVDEAKDLERQARLAQPAYEPLGPGKSTQ